MYITKLIFLSITVFFIQFCNKIKNNPDDVEIQINTKNLNHIQNNQNFNISEMDQLIQSAEKLNYNTCSFTNQIDKNFFLVKNKITVPDQVLNTIPSKVLLFGFGDSVSCSTLYGNGGVVGNNGYFTLLANSLNNLQIIKTIATDTSIIQQHLMSLRKIKKPYPKEFYGLTVFTTIGNNFLHPYGVAGRRGTNKTYTELPNDLQPNEAELYGVSKDKLINIYGPLLRNYLELIYKELKRIFPGGFHLFIANIYDPTDNTGKFENISINGRKNKLPPWKDGLFTLNYLNNNITGNFVKSHKNVSLVDNKKALMGFGINKYNTDEYAYMKSIFEDPNKEGSKKIKEKNIETMKKYLPLKIKNIIQI